MAPNTPNPYDSDEPVSNSKGYRTYSVKGVPKPPAPHQDDLEAQEDVEVEEETSQGDSSDKSRTGNSANSPSHNEEESTGEAHEMDESDQENEASGNHPRPKYSGGKNGYYTKYNISNFVTSKPPEEMDSEDDVVEVPQNDHSGVASSTAVDKSGDPIDDEGTQLQPTSYSSLTVCIDDDDGAPGLASREPGTEEPSEPEDVDEGKETFRVAKNSQLISTSEEEQEKASKGVDTSKSKKDKTTSTHTKETGPSTSDDQAVRNKDGTLFKPIEYWRKAGTKTLGSRTNKQAMFAVIDDLEPKTGIHMREINAKAKDLGPIVDRLLTKWREDHPKETARLRAESKANNRQKATTNQKDKAPAKSSTAQPKKPVESKPSKRKRSSDEENGSGHRNDDEKPDATSRRPKKAKMNAEPAKRKRSATEDDDLEEEHRSKQAKTDGPDNNASVSSKESSDSSKNKHTAKEKGGDKPHEVQQVKDIIWNIKHVNFRDMLSTRDLDGDSVMSDPPDDAPLDSPRGSGRRTVVLHEEDDKNKDVLLASLDAHLTISSLLNQREYIREEMHQGSWKNHNKKKKNPLLVKFDGKKRHLISLVKKMIHEKSSDLGKSKMADETAKAAANEIVEDLFPLDRNEHNAAKTRATRNALKEAQLAKKHGEEEGTALSSQEQSDGSTDNDASESETS